MGVGFALFAAGQAMQAFGQYNADQAQGSAERANAAYYREQEKMTLDEMFRELDIFERKAVKRKGDQRIHIGSRGSTINADQLLQMGYEESLMDREKAAIERQGRFKARLASLRAQQSEDTADALTSPERAFMTFGGGLLTGASALKFT